jgi:putative flavoprotein involved in K+ transport
MLETTADARIGATLSKLEEALSANDADAAAHLFAPVSYWRDILSFTWNIRTMEGRDEIRDMLAAQLPKLRATDFQVTEDAKEEDGTLEAFIAFETDVARCEGHIRIRDGLIHTLLTAVRELKGHEETIRRRRPLGARHTIEPGAPTWAESRAAESAAMGRDVQPFVLVVGSGQAGCALGARLKQLRVPALVIDRHERVGDAWRKRYKSLCLHDPVWYDHLPYLDFPDNWPVFAPKDKIADWLEFYASVMELDVWTRAEATRAEWDEAAGHWRVTVRREGEDVTLTPTHIVFATGNYGRPYTPHFPGMETFRGEQHHSADHPGPDAYAGKKVVIIGSNNSAHDIAAALYEVGAEPTMVQRTSTCVIRSDSLMEYGLGPLYSEAATEAGIGTHKADLLFASVPYALMAEDGKRLTDRIREVDADFYSRLEASGFWLDFGADGSGLGMKYLRRGSGYYIDIGASDLVADGRIRLAQGQVTEIVEDGVILEDGRKLPADVIVYATGYGPMNDIVADLVDEETAAKVGKVWGLGSGTPKDPGPWEGEQRNMWKPTAVRNMWFHGGNLHLSRHYSLYLAMQLKARLEGIETPVYGRAEVHHAR